MNKKTILMIPSWYPTKINPFNGCFFREQALAMEKDFDFVVLNYKKKKVLALLYLLRNILNKNKPQITFIQNDEGIKEYRFIDYVPQLLFLDLIVERFNRVILHKKNRDGVGRIESKYQIKSRRKHIAYIKKHSLLPDFDCVYTLTAQDMAFIGYDIKDIFSVPHITAEHAPFPWPGQVLSDYTVNAIETADAFLAISEDKIRQVLLQNIAITPYWMGNLCDETKFTISEENHTVPTFLIVAANSFYKNYSLFIKTMEELKRIAEKPFNIIIAGYDSNKGYSKNAKQLEEKVFNSTIRENTKMIKVVERIDMPKLYNSCDVFVMTSIQEGLPVSAIEASMCGLPVISTRCGGVEDYVTEEMGRVFSITDYQGLAGACNDFLNGTIKFDKNRIRNKSISLFGIEAFTKRMFNIFTEVLNYESNN